MVYGREEAVIWRYNPPNTFHVLSPYGRHNGIHMENSTCNETPRCGSTSEPIKDPAPMLNLTLPLRWGTKPVRLLCSDSTARPGLPCVGLAKWPDGVESLIEFALDGTRVFQDGSRFSQPAPATPITNSRRTITFTETGEVRKPLKGEWYVNGLSGITRAATDYRGMPFSILTRTESYE